MAARKQSQSALVCSVPVKTSRSTGILPVTANHGRDAHAAETPDGVTTNRIWRAEQSQFVGREMSGNWCYGKELGEKQVSCPATKTKPIREGLRLLRRDAPRNDRGPEGRAATWQRRIRVEWNPLRASAGVAIIPTFQYAIIPFAWRGQNHCLSWVDGVIMMAGLVSGLTEYGVDNGTGTTAGT
jgi:hypothetical protein